MNAKNCLFNIQRRSTYNGVWRRKFFFSRFSFFILCTVFNLKIDLCVMWIWSVCLCDVRECDQDNMPRTRLQQTHWIYIVYAWTMNMCNSRFRVMYSMFENHHKLLVVWCVSALRLTVNHINIHWDTVVDMNVLWYLSMSASALPIIHRNEEINNCLNGSAKPKEIE